MKARRSASTRYIEILTFCALLTVLHVPAVLAQSSNPPAKSESIEEVTSSNFVGRSTGRFRRISSLQDALLTTPLFSTTKN
jgi:hypothetical protein